MEAKDSIMSSMNETKLLSKNQKWKDLSNCFSQKKTRSRNFMGSNMQNFSLIEGKMIQCYFTYTFLEECFFLDSYIEDTEFYHADLQHGQFEEIVFEDCDFPGTLMKECRFIDCTFIECDFKAVNARLADFTGCDFEKCDISGIFVDANIETAHFEGCDTKDTLIDRGEEISA